MTPFRTIWDWLTPADRVGAVMAGLGMASAGFWAGELWAGGPQALPLGFLGVSAFAIFRIDSRHFLIPDLLVLPLALAGLGHGVIGGAALGPALLAAALSFAALTAFRQVAGWVMRREAFGGGDVKLIAAAALWLPAEQMPTYLLAAALSALVEALLSRSRRLAFGRHLAPWLCLLTLASPAFRL